MGECGGEVRRAIRMDKELKTEFRIDDGIVLRAWREDDVEIAYDVVIRNRDHLRSFMHWMTPDYSIESSKKFLNDAIANRRARKNLGRWYSKLDIMAGVLRTIRR